MTRHVAIAVVALPSAVFAQLALSPVDEAALQEIVARIEEIQSLQIENNPDLIDPLTELASFYEERGASDLALAAIEQTTQVIEVNHGLHTLEEAQLMQRSIRIERARGNAEAA